MASRSVNAETQKNVKSFGDASPSLSPRRWATHHRTPVSASSQATGGKEGEVKPYFEADHGLIGTEKLCGN